MTDLLQRLEALTSPCREVDAEIHHWYLDGLGTGYRQDAPLYTRSIDAAMSLVPEGWDGSVPITMDGRCVELWKVGIAESNVFGLAATPAIALCIAALKARKEL